MRIINKELRDEAKKMLDNWLNNFEEGDSISVFDGQIVIRNYANCELQSCMYKPF